MPGLQNLFWRKLILSPKREWLRFDYLFMLGGVIIAVATLTTAMLLFGGYERALKQQIMGTNSHIYLFPNHADYLQLQEQQSLLSQFQQDTRVEATQAVVVKPAMLSAHGKVRGCVIRGINQEPANTTTRLQHYIIKGDYLFHNSQNIIIGEELAKQLQVQVGDSITVMTPQASGSALGIMTEEIHCRVNGLFRSGMYDYDVSFVYMPRQTAQTFFGIGNQTSYIEIKLKEPFIKHSQRIAATMQSRWGDSYQIHSWEFFEATLFSLLTMEKALLFILLSFMVLIASFSIVSASATMLIERRRDIGILQALGATPKLIKQLLYGRVFLLSCVGIMLGEVAGWLLALLLNHYAGNYLRAEVYFTSQLVIRFDLAVFLSVACTAIVIAGIGAYLPLRRLDRMTVTQILRDE